MFSLRKLLLVLIVQHGEEIIIALFGTLNDGFIDVAWEFGQVDNVVVEIVFQVLSTFAPSVAVVDSENLNVGPILDRGEFI